MKQNNIFLLSLFFFFSSHAFSQTQAKFQFTPYGKIKATEIVADNATNTFSYVNLSAPTSAAYTDEITAASINGTANSFQVAQSRIGFNIDKDKIHSNIEMDFISFSKSTPTTESNPRLRRAFIQYKINDNNWFQMGQDWDTFSPLTPDVLDYVGLNFEAGNLGFQRQQMKWNYHKDDFSSEVSLGFTSKNAGPELSSLETRSTPTLAYAIEKAKFNLSFLVSKISKGTSPDNSLWGVELSRNALSLGSKVKVKFAAYTGQNLADGATLGLSKQSTGLDQKEAGGYLGLTYQATDNWKLNYTYSRAQILNDENLADFTYDNAAGKITNLGIKSNELNRLTSSTKLVENLDFVFEATHFHTLYKTIAGEQSRSVVSVESGLLLVF